MPCTVRRRRRYGAIFLRAQPAGAGQDGRRRRGGPGSEDRLPWQGPVPSFERRSFKVQVLFIIILYQRGIVHPAGEK